MQVQRPDPTHARERADEARARRDAATRRAATRDQMNDVHPGDVIAGRYRVDGVLGRTRGLLLEASHCSFEQRVIVRLISPALADPKAIDRFQRETRILAQLESEHVARILDVGTLPNGALYLVREHLDGDKLSHRSRSQALPVTSAVDLFLQICEAVGEAHSRGVVLRDLQSGHVFITKRRNGEPVAKLTDFGTCKVMRRESSAEMSCTKLLGLSVSASPELVRQQSDIDERADVWSLGCMLYEMLTGGSAFLGDGTALMLAIAQDNPLPPSSLRVDIDIPKDLDRIILRALSKDRTARYASVYEMVRNLRPYASARGQLLIEQIARLAGEEPTALSEQRDRHIDSCDSEDTMAMVIADSEPERGSVPPPQYHSVPAPNPYAQPIPYPARVAPPAMLSAMPAPRFSAALPFAPPAQPAAAARAVGEAYHQGPHARTSELAFSPPVGPAPAGPAPAASAWSATANRAGYDPANGLRPVMPWEQNVTVARRSNKLKLAVALAMLPLAVLFVVVVASSGAGEARAQGGLLLPSPEAIVAEIAEAPSDIADDVADGESPKERAATPERETARAARKGDAAASSDATLSGAGSEKPRSKKARKGEQFLASLGNEPSDGAESAPTASKGTIVAMAVGASCAFAVDGAGRGSSSSIKVTVDAGRHTVSCSPTGGGAARSRTVTVPPGKAAVAVFRF